MKFNFDSHLYPYPSKRNVVYSQRGMVATGNPYAAQAGLQVMKDGGNAIDAAIAAGTLTGERFAGRWVDVGTPQRLAELDQELGAA